jgi:hypothetical protein
MTDDLRDDERGAFSVHLAVFFGTLVIGAFLYILIQPAASEMLNLASNQTTTTDAAQGQSYVRTAIQNAHFLVVGFGLLQLVAAAVYSGRVGR